VNSEFTIFSGLANPALAKAIAHELGAEVGPCTVGRYPDGDVAVELLESVRRKEVFLVQPTSPPLVNDNLLELLALADACRRDGAARITAIMPFFGYSRADKRHGREPIMARVVADLLQSVGIDHIVSVDPHSPQIEGFFHAPVDSLTAVPVLCAALRNRLPADLVVVSPDMGRVEMATRYAEECLGAPVVVLHKRRVSGLETKVTRIVGDVAGRACLIIDDMISTGGTIGESITALLHAGARPEIIVAATHGVFVLNARQKLSHPAVREVLVTDTVSVAGKDWPQLHVISIAALIASSLQRILADRGSHNVLGNGATPGSDREAKHERRA
jgi:ribose-phosphate pyrophosphokinase